MATTLYYGSGSPYAWRVWLALEHKQIPYEFKLTVVRCRRSEDA